MYVIERNGELYGPYESYQAAAIASGDFYQGPHSNAPSGTSSVREVHSPTNQAQGLAHLAGMQNAAR